MPELPEVETSRRGIEPHLVGATIMHATVRNGRLRWPVSEEIYRLSDKPVLSVQRRAKYLLLELSDGWVIIHWGCRVVCVSFLKSFRQKNMTTST